jgi:hypothetical protein
MRRSVTKEGLQRNVLSWQRQFCGWLSVYRDVLLANGPFAERWTLWLTR